VRCFSLQGNVKTLEGEQNPDRDARFRYLNEQIGIHRGDHAAAEPARAVGDEHSAHRGNSL
jgi:hypothetical protein